MTIVIIVMSVLNIIFGLVSALPCLMIAAMSGDNPKYAGSPAHVALVWAMLSFPVICMTAGIASPILWYAEFKALSVITTVWPIVEAAIFFLMMAAVGYFYPDN